jgi:lysophospholipase L1-like esterase
LRDSIDYTRRHGLTVGLRNLIEGAGQLGIAEQEIILRVNRNGYKGPELDSSHSRPRILAIGDSCTFGTWFDYYSYPRSLERAMVRRGLLVEVVNAGVGGYSPVNALARIGEFKELRPEITIVYIGWNALWDGGKPLRSIWESFATVRLVQALRWRWSTRGRSDRELALEQWSKLKVPDPDAPEVGALQHHSPSFLPDVEEIIVAMRSQGSRVFVATLPGLYVSGEPISREALEKGHLPRYTDNPYVAAALADAYNTRLRSLARKEATGLIDLAEWSRKALRPRHDYFTDSVHLTPQGQQAIGEHIAGELSKHLSEGRD